LLEDQFKLAGSVTSLMTGGWLVQWTDNTSQTVLESANKYLQFAIYNDNITITQSNRMRYQLNQP